MAAQRRNPSRRSARRERRHRTEKLCPRNTHEYPQSFTTPELSSYLKISESWLRQRRMTGTLDDQQPGPPYVRCGRSVRYVKAHVDEWLAKRSRS